MRSVVLVVGGDAAACVGVERALAARGYACISTTTDTAVATCLRCHPRVVAVVASNATVTTALACLEQLSHGAPRATCLFLASRSSEELAIAALRAGAQHYLKEPWTAETLHAAISELMPAVSAEPGEPELAGGDQLVGRSQCIRDLRAKIRRIAPASSNVRTTSRCPFFAARCSGVSPVSFAARTSDGSRASSRSTPARSPASAALMMASVPGATTNRRDNCPRRTCATS